MEVFQSVLATFTHDTMFSIYIVGTILTHSDNNRIKDKKSVETRPCSSLDTKLWEYVDSIGLRKPSHFSGNPLTGYQTPDLRLSRLDTGPPASRSSLIHSWACKPHLKTTNCLKTCPWKYSSSYRRPLHMIICFWYIVGTILTHSEINRIMKCEISVETWTQTSLDIKLWEYIAWRCLRQPPRFCGNPLIGYQETWQAKPQIYPSLDETLVPRFQVVVSHWL
jgi:hypothetical protein